MDWPGIQNVCKIPQRLTLARTSYSSGVTRFQGARFQGSLRAVRPRNGSHHRTPAATIILMTVKAIIAIATIVILNSVFGSISVAFCVVDAIEK